MRLAFLLACTATIALSQGNPRIETGSTLPEARVGSVYLTNLSASGGFGILTWQVTSGNLPPGLTLISLTGTITGIPTTPGDYAFTGTVRDSGNRTASQNFLIRVLSNTPPSVQTNNPPDGTVGTAYAAGLTASGGTPPYTWNLSGGALPAGLTLASNGAINGTPATPGTSTFTARVTDATNQSSVRDLQINIAAAPVAAPSITATPLPGGTVGQSYSASLSATGGTAPYTWTVASGTLPAGLNLAPNGAITGTPTAAGTSTFTARVTDATNQSSTRDFQIIVGVPPAPTISATPLPAGTVGQTYSAALTATGGTGAFTWTVANGALPAGLTLASNGAITGTPTAAGTSTFTARVTDANNQSSTRDFQIIIGAPPAPTISATPLPGGTVGQSYSASLTATGGTGSYTWAVSNGSLPAGLTLAPNGAITGTPTTAGTATFTARVTDAANQSSTRDIQITITAAPAPTISATPLPGGTVGQSYSATLTATGGTGAYTWTVANGTLPTGLNLAPNGSITGTPTTAGTATFTARVTDAANQSSTRDLQITITAAPAPTISATPLPGGTVGQSYSATLTATGGTGAYTWTVASGALPAGLNLAPNGAITGTPTTAGTGTFTARVTDATNQSSTRDLQITITAAPAPTISATPMPAGTVGQSYSTGLTATGGTGPYTWSVSNGALPAGLNLASNGAITGTPTTAGTADFTARVTDANNQSSTRTFQITITGAPTPVISTTSLSGGTVGQSYSASLTATSGTPPYTWAVSSGTLPAGLTLGSTGAITGTPTTAGASTFTARVTDAANQSATRQLQIAIAAAVTPLGVVTTSLPNTTVGAEYGESLTASGGRAPYTWSVAAGTLPPGVTLNSSGRVAGTPSATGSYSFVARVTDADNRTAERSLSFTVGAALAIPGCPAATGLVGTNYSATLTAAGGIAPYFWSVTSGQLPPGVSLASATGVISGSPILAGPFRFTLNVSDASNRSATRDCTITIASPLQIMTDALPDATTTARYFFTPRATGGTAPYTWTISGGALPPGITTDPATGTLTGQPTQPGRYTFAVRVTDGSGGSSERTYTITVTTGLAIPSCPTVTAIAGGTYDATLQAVGGQAPYSWTVASGNLPAGLSLAGQTGAISGIPTAAGTANFSIRTSDQSGATAERACSIQVAPELTITTSSLPPAQVGTAYTAGLQVTGGLPPHNWNISAGALPGGLTLNSATGQITGTPGAAGVFRLTARVSDSAGNQREREFELTVGAGFVISACPVPSAVIGEAYSSAPSLSGGDAPLAWALASGSLPAGLSLSPETGAIAGAATTAGTANFVLRVTDGTSRTTTRACSINVNPSALRISATGRLKDAVLGSAYAETLQASGGRGPYVWSRIDGTLPPGLTFASDGTVGGTPTASGVYRFTVSVADADRGLATGLLELRVMPARTPNVSFGDLPDIIAPAQQPRVRVTVDEPYPVALRGRLRLGFNPDPGLNVDDPSVTFVDGSRAMDFEIPANTTEAVFPVPQNALQTGSVAGVINLDATLSAGEFDVTPTPAPAKALRVDRTAPVITNVRVNPVSGGFEVVVTGLSTTREVTSATFQFTPAAGSRLDASQVTVPTEAAARQWFSDTRSSAFGGQFTFTQPFSLQNATLSEVTVTLTNGQGTSQPVRARF